MEKLHSIKLKFKFQLLLNLNRLVNDWTGPRPTIHPFYYSLPNKEFMVPSAFQNYNFANIGGSPFVAPAIVALIKSSLCKFNLLIAH